MKEVLEDLIDQHYNKNLLETIGPYLTVGMLGVTLGLFVISGSAEVTGYVVSEGVSPVVDFVDDVRNSPNRELIQMSFYVMWIAVVILGMTVYDEMNR